MNSSILTITDSYKLGRILEYPKGTNLINEVLVARDVKYFTPVLLKTIEKHGLIVAGIQNSIRELDKVFSEQFEKPTVDYVNDIKRDFINILGKTPTDEYLDKFVELKDYYHEHGELPITYSYIKEGTRIPIGTPYCKFHNSDPRFYWLPNFMETLFMSSCWLATVNATINFYLKAMLLEHAEKSAMDNSYVNFQAHDFSMRGNQGLSGSTQNSIGHLMSFNGSDTLYGIRAIEKVYGQDNSVPVLHSVSAFEHSSVTTNVQYLMSKGLDINEAEKQSLIRFITEVYPTGIVAYVADSYDFWQMVANLKDIKDIVEARDGKLVIRPDSDIPYNAICGYPHRTITDMSDIQSETYEYMECPPYDYIYCESTDTVYTYKFEEFTRGPNDKCWKMVLQPVEMTYYQMVGLVKSLDHIFGSTINEKGYKVLNPKVGAIYGDGITYDIADKILKRLIEMGYSAESVVFGMGTFWQCYYTRDNLGIALKTTYAEVDGVPVDVVKHPKTSSGTVKKSPKGDVKVYRDHDTGKTWWLDSTMAMTKISKDSNVEMILNENNKQTWFEVKNTIESELKLLKLELEQ